MNNTGPRSDRSHRGIEAFRERLKELRNERGVSQQELANRVKEYLGEEGQAYQSYIGNMEDSKKSALPSVQALRAIAVILETNTDYLLGLTTDSRPTGDVDDQVVVVVEDPDERRIVQEVAEALARANKDERLYVAGLVRKLLPKKPRIIGDE